MKSKRVELSRIISASKLLKVLFLAQSGSHRHDQITIFTANQDDPLAPANEKQPSDNQDRSFNHSSPEAFIYLFYFIFFCF